MEQSNKQFQRNEIIIGKNNQNKLKTKKIMVLGVGGVGSELALSLARMGIGYITIVDYDIFDETNINRQACAFWDTVGLKKTLVLEGMLKRINPMIKVHIIDKKLTTDNIEGLKLKEFDYICDCIDTISAKVEIISYAYHNNIPIISSMGAGGKLNPLDFKVSDIHKTSVCPMARVIRRMLRKRNVKRLKCVYSTEDNYVKSKEREDIRKSTPGSVSFIPPVVGLIMCSEVIKDIINGDC